MCRLATSQKSRFQAAKLLNISSAILQDGRFADAQESSIIVVKWSDMCSVDMKLLLLADAQESTFQVWKRLYMAREALQSVRFANYQE